ncbi:MAG: protein YgfX [Psychrobium sp.]
MKSKYSVEVTASRLRTISAVSAFAVLHGLMFYFSMRWFSSIWLGIMLWGGGFIAACALLWLEKEAHYVLTINQPGDVHYRGHLIFDARILPTSVESHLLVCLKLEETEEAKHMQLLIWRDAVSQQQYRRLRRIIRHRQRYVNEGPIP